MEQEEQQHVLELITAHKRRKRELEKKAALFGASADPSVHIEIEDIEKKIKDLEPQVEKSVSGMGLPTSLITTGRPPPAVNYTPAILPPVASPPALTSILPVQQAAPQGSLSYSSAALALDAPQIQSYIGRRTESVGQLVKEAADVTWIALHGNTGRGKTRLARLLADSLGASIVWLPFAGREDNSSSGLVEQFCTHFAKHPPPALRAEWYKAACQALPAGGVLVLDDLPNLTSSPNLAARLEPIIRGCAERGVRVISTSLYPLPMSVLSDLEGLCGNFPAPVFTDKDVEEVLKASNAPDSIVTQGAKFINLVSRQHPTLIVAACRYLETLDWKLEEDGIQGLFKGEHVVELADEVRQKLQATIPDALTRQLVYRLSLIAGSFSARQIDALAKVPPPINGARELLHNITNSWVEQQDGSGQWALSPLIGNAVRDHLAADERKACHLALGEEVFYRKTFTPHTAFVGISHLLLAEAWGKAGAFLVVVLNEFQSHVEKLADDTLLHLWTKEPIPPAMDLNLRLAIRGAHILLFSKLGKPLDYLFSDLDSLLSQATEMHRLGAAGAVSYVVLGVGRKYPMQAGKWLRQYLKIPVAKKVGQPKKTVADDEPVYVMRGELPTHLLLWLLVGELHTPDQVSDWLDTLEAFSVEARRQAFQSMRADGDAHVRSIVISDILTGIELAKPEKNRNWPAVVAKLTEFAARAKSLKVELLWAAFIRAKVIAQAEYCKDLEGAIATATEAAAQASGDPVVYFMIDAAIGRPLAFAKHYKDARFWLGRAVSRKSKEIFSYDRTISLLGASQVFGDEDPSLGAKYALEATQVAESSEAVPTIERAKAWSELGVAQFYAKGAAASLESWDKAGEYLYNKTERTDEWKEQMVLFGHTLSYIAKVAEAGKPPEFTSGGDVYAAPVRGAFLTTNPARVAYFNMRNTGAAWRIIGYFADAVGNTDLGNKWRARAAEAGKRDSVLALVSEAGRDEIVKVLRESGYRATLEEGRKAAKAMVVFSHELKLGNSGIVPETDMPAAVGGLDELERAQVEEFGMVIGLIPCLLSVATLFVKDDSTAQAEAEKLVAASRDIAPDTFAPARWNWMAEAIERGFVLRQTEKQIGEWGTALEEKTHSSFFVLHLARGANAKPEEAFRILLPIMPSLCRSWPAKTAVYHELLMPYFVEYWTRRFENERFFFGLAMVVESMLPQAVAEPEEKRVAAVFRAVHAGFKMAKLPDELRKWLFSN